MMNRLISYLLFFFSAINSALSFAVPPVPEVVYRLDSRSPDEIFNSGFNSWGNNRELLPHLVGDTSRNRTDGLISTSSNINAIERIAQDIMLLDDDVVWLYTIVPGSDFYEINGSLLNAYSNPNLPESVRNQSLNMHTRFGWQHEYVNAAGHIDRSTIINARQVRWVNGSIDMHNTEIRDNPNVGDNLLPAVNANYLLPNQEVANLPVGYFRDFEDDPTSLPFSLDGCLNLSKKGPVCKSVSYSLFKESIIDELNGRLFILFLSV